MPINPSHSAICNGVTVPRYPILYCHSPRCIWPHASSTTRYHTTTTYLSGWDGGGRVESRPQLHPIMTRIKAHSGVSTLTVISRDSSSTAMHCPTNTTSIHSSSLLSSSRCPTSSIFQSIAATSALISSGTPIVTTALPQNYTVL